MAEAEWLRSECAFSAPVGTILERAKLLSNEPDVRVDDALEDRFARFGSGRSRVPESVVRRV
ncbi:hypothetical protein [Natronobeatus ordinarius]|uniref:hypothetical protein n=1 Tax=Natronobeatus ordinarius TaxID=2963433 RepID=UPI0020CE68C4|nr:hypothetical protein [Natronobeatus ordinarius]